VAVATLLAALTAAGFGPSQGVVVRAPVGWFAWTPAGPAQGVTNPVLRRELIGPAGTVIQIRELVPPLLARGALASFPPRPRRFHVGSFSETAGCVLPGSLGTRFREDGRAFYVVVVKPTPAVGAVLDSLRVEPR
jgi:hypothetical protein